MNNVIKTFAVGILITGLAACANIISPIDEDYQFGDLTKSTLQVQAKYCAETDPVQRAVMLTAIRSALPDFPASGACTELYKVIPKNTVSDVASDVDLEQALEDQKKFQEKVQ